MNFVGVPLAHIPEKRVDMPIQLELTFMDYAGWALI